MACTSTGMPPLIAAWRAGFILLPAWMKPPLDRGSAGVVHRRASRHQEYFREINDLTCHQTVAQAS
jgi:hypothetical protein